MKRIDITQSMSYPQVLQLQQKEFDLRVGCRKRDTQLPEDIVFLVEHRPVYTIGVHGNPSHLLLSDESLHAEGIDYVRIDRGGDITYHGPGQLTVYPVVDMLRYRLGVKDYIHLLEQTVIDVLSVYGLRGERIEGKTGVWIGKGTGSERKISAIGVRCSRHVSMHGFAFNVGSDITKFSGIVPCGLTSGVTSLSIELGREIPLSEVREIVWEKLTSLLLPRIPSQGNS